MLAQGDLASPKTGPGKMLDLNRFEREILMSKKRYGAEQAIDCRRQGGLSSVLFPTGG